MTDKELMEEMDLRIDKDEANREYEDAWYHVMWELDGLYDEGFNEFDVMEEANRIMIGV